MKEKNPINSSNKSYKVSRNSPNKICSTHYAENDTLLKDLKI